MCGRVRFPAVPLCKVLKKKPKLQWRLQNFGNAETSLKKSWRYQVELFQERSSSRAGKAGLLKPTGARWCDKSQMPDKNFMIYYLAWFWSCLELVFLILFQNRSLYFLPLYIVCLLVRRLSLVTEKTFDLGLLNKVRTVKILRILTNELRAFHIRNWPWP